MLQTGRLVAFGLPRHQPSAIRGAAGWSARRIRPVAFPIACWQGCRNLVSPLRLLCPTADQLPTGVLPCYRSPVVRYSTGQPRPNAR
ncbi:hypothetical protein BHE74_00007396 [Ensete ventricosum]|nr:hypothetical protein BHE74_00007396 [Ensete ventricosum]